MLKRFEMFEKICLPSLQKQDVTPIAMISKEMPEIYVNRLQQHVHVVVVTNPADNREVLRNFKPKGTIATVKLDDDDALHPEFAEKIKVYMRTTKPTLVSFPNGCQVVYNTEKCKKK
jgi:hypothetical protein